MKKKDELMKKDVLITMLYMYESLYERCKYCCLNKNKMIFFLLGFIQTLQHNLNKFLNSPVLDHEVQQAFI